MCGPRLVLCQFKNKSWRNYEPHFFIAVFFLSACSDHSKNTSANENSSNAQIETSKIQSNESSELSEIPLGEALDFIKSRLSRRVVGKEMWVPSDVSLAKNSWTWSESTYLTTGDDGLDGVSARQLRKNYIPSKPLNCRTQPELKRIKSQ